MESCLRCGKCCHYNDEAGKRKRCRYLKDTSDGKTMCRIYDRRIGTQLDHGIYCNMRSDDHRIIPGCPLNRGAT